MSVAKTRVTIDFYALHIGVANMVVSNAPITAITDMLFRQQIIFIQYSFLVNCIDSIFDA